MLSINVDNYIISPYGIFLVTSIIAGLIIAVILLIRSKVNRNIIILSVMIVATLIIYFGLSFTYLVNLFKGGPRFGFTSSGGAIGVIAGSFIVYAVTKEEKILRYYFLIIPLVYSISKLGCFSAGCCGGIEYHGFGAIQYLGSRDYLADYPTIPVPLIESVVFAIIFALMLFNQKKLSCENSIFINVLSCAAAKFALDFLRAAHVGEILSVNQISCIVLALVVTMLLFIMRRKRKLREKSK